MNTLKGMIFNVQPFSIHDGPGIRNVVFFKGCSLRCSWCSNPESQLMHPELSHNRSRCLGVATCGTCVKACPHGAILGTEENLPGINRNECRHCGLCASACPAKALKLMGRTFSVEELAEQLHHDDNFYSHSEGGVTLGGGEAMLQPDFASALLKLLGEEGIHRALETAGSVPFEAFEKVCPHLDLLIFDIKHSDPELHAVWTGRDNLLILQNLERISAAFPKLPILIRTPVIPGVNDSEEVIEAIAQIALRIPSVIRYELLPYHRFGESKYQQLDREYPYNGPKEIDKALVARLQLIADKVASHHAARSF